jgi:hypothetical protein
MLALQNCFSFQTKNSLHLGLVPLLPSIYLWGKAGVGWGKRSWLIHFTPEIFQENALTRSVAAEELTETPFKFEFNSSDRSDDHSLSPARLPALTRGHPRIE